MKQISANSLSALERVAEEVISSLDGRTVVAFCGAMGAGKTTLISAIMRLLGSEDSVTSPTFALVNSYTTGVSPFAESIGKEVYHFDFYRINRIEEVFDMGYEEYFYSGNLCLIEWPELIEDLLPEDAMVVRIDVVSPTERLFTID
jgi:tRNA threonylcarbamoyladenosine biosynthesis protein TsaE